MRNTTPETRNTTPETRNPKPETRNPNHETPKTKNETRMQVRITIALQICDGMVWNPRP